MADIQLAQAVNALNSTPNNNGGDDPNDPPITNKIRQSWNDYIIWLKGKGLAGSSKLDKGGVGMKMIDEYRKENPDTPLTRELVKPIQHEFARYRQYALDQVDKGQMLMAEGVTKENFLKSLSKVDGLPGQLTTSYSFPSGFMKDMNKNETKSNFLNSEETAQQTLAKTQTQ